MENNNIKKPVGPILPIGSNLWNTEYVIDKYLTSGGMHTDIYLCHSTKNPHKKLVTKVVYKKTAGVDEELWNKLYVEGKTSLRLFNQANLIQTHDVLVSPPNDPDKKMCIIMDYIEGKDLKTYLAIHGTLSVKSALTIFLKICNGIKPLHNFKRQIIHRDLKPENIMISDDSSTVTIIDFGISTVIDTTQKALGKVTILNDETNLYGTPEYIMPDTYNQYSSKIDPSKRKITVQADFFALGIILYEMIMGCKPFDYTGCNSKASKIKLAVKYDMLNISANPTIPTSLENLIFRCIASKPEDIKYRYNSIEEIIEDVKKIIPLINKADPTPLLKPLEKRMYQKAKIINIDVVKNNQKIYKHWWFFAVVMLFSIGLLIACIVMFFVIE